jgi:hypothetical protein
VTARKPGCPVHLARMWHALRWGCDLWPRSIAAVRHEVLDAHLPEPGGRPYGSGKPLPVSSERTSAGGCELMGFGVPGHLSLVSPGQLYCGGRQRTRPAGESPSRTIPTGAVRWWSRDRRAMERPPPVVTLTSGRSAMHALATWTAKPTCPTGWLGRLSLYGAESTGLVRHQGRCRRLYCSRCLDLRS